MKQFGKLLWSLIEAMALWCLRLLFKIIRKGLTPETEEGFLQFVKFGMVGVTNVIVSYLINVAVLLVLAPANVSWDYVAGNLIAFFLSVLWSFHWNNKYVFTQKEGENRNRLKALLKTYASYGFSGLVLMNVLAWFWIDVVGLSKFIAPIIDAIICIPINFLMNKFWAFEEK